MRSLRILYVLPYVPSPIRVRPFQIIRHLARMGHAVTVAALEDGFVDAAAVRELRAVCTEVHIVPHGRTRALLSCIAAVPTPTPLWAAFTRSPLMDRLLRRLSASGRFDVAHVEHLRAAHFAAHLGDLPRILDAVDCITDLRRQMLEQRNGRALNRVLSWEEWVKLRRYEPRIYRQYRRIAVTSNHDARALLALDPLLPPVEVIPNGVDLEYFQPRDEPPPDADRIVFSGKMSYQANDDAARYFIGEILPRLRALRPETRLTVAGSSPSPGLIADAARAGGVEVTGYVTDLRPYISRSMISVCPMRIGVGIQNKVLEAMAMGRPVVCSSLAARSLMFLDESGAQTPAPVRVADDADRFAAICADLLEESSGAARQAGLIGRKYVEKYHHWKTASEMFTALYSAVSMR